MNTIKLGDKVRILDNAFEGSDDPTDFEARGKIGEVVYIFGEGAIEVQTEDDEFYPLTVDEVEVIESEGG